MPVVSSLTCDQLYLKFQSIVGNANLNRGRDRNMLSKALETLSPVQLMLGMYKYRGRPNMSVPALLRLQDEWVIWDDNIAKIELATFLENTVPTHYYVWKELQEEENADSYAQSIAALTQLKAWANRVVL